MCVLQCGWYWGPMNWEDAEMKLKARPDGSFLVRDSSDPRYILSLSFRSQGVTHHTRMEHYRGETHTHHTQPHTTSHTTHTTTFGFSMLLLGKFPDCCLDRKSVV